MLNRLSIFFTSILPLLCLSFISGTGKLEISMPSSSEELSIVFDGSSQSSYDVLRSSSSLKSEKTPFSLVVCNLFPGGPVLGL